MSNRIWHSLKPWLTPLFFLLIFTIGVLGLIGYLLSPDLFEVIKDSTRNQPENAVIQLHAAAVTFLTFALVLVAYVKLDGAKKLESSRFLLELDKRYGCKEILRAREIIHELYLESVNKNKVYSESEHRTNIGQMIVDLSKIEKPKDIEKYIYLLNLLDFLETVAYMGNKDDLKAKDIEEVIGNSFCFFYEIFELKIKQRREKYAKPSFYCEFEKLCNKIREN